MKINKLQKFDVIVIGGGHAGIEAAHAASRLGVATALVTHDPREVGRMPCNPAIGGLGKGHLVRELDVLGGVMGRVIDRVGIQFRTLNRRKGPAVRAPRAQADKLAYQETMSDLVAAMPHVTVVAGDAVALLRGDGSGRDVGAERLVASDRPVASDGPVAFDRSVASDRPVVAGVRLDDGRELLAPRVVLCSGTFLGGLMHTGEEKTSGGREGATASMKMGASLADAGFELVRLKTGTPPRLHRDSLDYGRLERQPGDPEPGPFSHFTTEFSPSQIDCWTTATGPASHDLIRENLARSPLFAGAISGAGPRYCPSIEDKIVRFPDRSGHTLFLEPEGRDSLEIYVNGASTSLPRDVQERVIRSVPGLERAEFLRFGYAVEYDSVPSRQIGRTLESSPVPGLWLAGQILGTSGYEEAAAQGLVAGYNAAASLVGREPLILRRDEAYLGVLVDDLNTKIIAEPYRMFTSRAEHRLSLRCDNAATRLLGRAETLGLLGRGEVESLRERVGAVRGLIRGLGALPRRGDPRASSVSTLERLRRPEESLATLSASRDDVALLVSESLAPLPSSQVSDARLEAETTVKYEGYIARQDRLVRERAHLDELEIPAEFRYHDHPQLSAEAREKLERLRPATLGQAARIDGVRAADLSILSVLIRALS